MTITSTGGGNPTIRINSTAKNGTLGTQTAGTANQITLPSSLNAANNGNVTAPLVGRLIIIRRGTATEETKKIITGADTATEIFVHEDWTNAPQSGDTYDISYVFGDLTAFTGITLSTKTGIYEASRLIAVGTAGGGTFAYLALKDAEAYEIRDDAANASLVVESRGRFDAGYKIGGRGAGGGIMHALNNANSEPCVQLTSGSFAKFFDTVMISFREEVEFQADANSNVEIDTLKTVNFTGFSTAQFICSGSTFDFEWIKSPSFSTYNGIVVIPTLTVDTWRVVGPWVSTQLDSTTQTYDWRNVSWTRLSSVVPFVRVGGANKTVDLVNPTFPSTINTGSHFDIAWINAAAGAGSEVNVKYSLGVTTVSASGAPISGSAVYVYEGLVNQNLPTDNQMYTDINGEDTSDVLSTRYTSGSTFLRVTQSGDFSIKAYRYGYRPYVAGTTFDGPVESQIALILDTNLSASNEWDALANGGTGITPIKHSPGETDALPLLVFHYDGGAGTAPSAGQVVSGTTSTAQGSVLELRYGDNTDAYLVLSGWNGIQFTNNETIGNDSGWSALADTTGGASSFQEEYTWEYQMSGSSHQVVYDYDRARLASHPSGALSAYLQAIIWGEDEQSSMIYSNGTSFFTERNVNLQQGVWLTNSSDPGSVEYMTSDSGSQFVPPQSYTFTLTGLRSLSEVRIYDTSTNPPTELAGTENSSTTFSYNYVYSGADVDIFVVIFHLQYRDIRLTGLTLSNADQSIPIQQQTDRVYSNPT